MDVHRWLLESEEPWTRYRTRLDLLEQDNNDLEVIRDREEMLSHQEYKKLIRAGESWPGYPLKRHNDAKHPLQALTVLADFGANQKDPGINRIIKRILSRQSDEGAFETQIQLYKAFGGLEGEYWTWMGCDAPVLLYALSAFGLESDPRILAAKEHILSLINDYGWGCSAAPILGNFKGPGKRDDPCPIANLQAIKALSLDPELIADDSVMKGVEMLLHHWEIQGEKKFYLFGIGTDFKKLKYPLIWYDLLHVTDVLSRFPAVSGDKRFLDMVSMITRQADESGFFTASSMYMAWKGWSFSNKKQPSPWLTFLVNRILKRAGLR